MTSRLVFMYYSYFFHRLFCVKLSFYTIYCIFYSSVDEYLYVLQRHLWSIFIKKFEEGKMSPLIIPSDFKTQITSSVLNWTNSILLLAHIGDGEIFCRLWSKLKDKLQIIKHTGK